MLLLNSKLSLSIELAKTGTMISKFNSLYFLQWNLEGPVLQSFDTLTKQSLTTRPQAFCQHFSSMGMGHATPMLDPRQRPCLLII